MRLLKQLTIQGFKSFANKTVIEFQHGFNCVIGPNGAGKSNVLDALCFVLGKSSSKGLRVEKASNLLFNGGKKGKPASKAVVTLHFDNSTRIFPIDSDEVKISRTLNVKGHSVYRINDKKATRNQVLDLLAAAKINPEGYNIILQGDIIRFVEMSPLARRELIEDVSGIQVYESKREKALRELSRVEERINEAKIIISERETYLKELKKDYEQASKYRSLKQSLKQAKATLIKLNIEKKKEAIANIEKNFSKIKEVIDKDKTRIKKLQQEVNNLKQELKNVNKEIESKGEKEQLEIHKKVEDLRVKIAVNEQQLQTMQSELENSDQRKQQLLKNIEDLKTSIASINEKIKSLESRIKSRTATAKSLEQKIASLKQKHSLQAAADIDKKIQDLDAKIDVLNEDVLNLRKEEQELIRTVDKIDLMIKTAQSRAERVKKATGKDQALIESLKSKQQRLKQIQKEISTLVKKDSELALQLSTADNKLSLKKEQLAKIKARAEVSQSLNDAIKAVLKKPGVYGTISQLGSVSKEHALALQIAAGSRINDVVVQSADVASKLIEFLRKEKIGVCSFIPLKEIKPPEISAQVKSLEKTPGVVGLAINLVRFDKKFEKAFQYVFGDSIIVKDLQVAKKLGVGSGLRMITLEGDLIEKSGRMRGGFRKHKRSGFVISSDNVQDVSKIEAEVSDLQSVIARLTSERKQVNEELQSLRLEQAKLEAEINATEKQVMLSIEDLEATKVEISKLNKELKEKQKLLEDLRLKIRDKLLSIARLKQEKSKLRDELKSLRSPTALAELSAFEEELKTVNTEIAEFNANLKALINERDNLLKPELERVEKLLHNLNKDVENFKLEKKKLLETLKQDKKLLRELETQERSLVKRFKSLFDKRAQITDLIAKKELMIAELSNKVTSQEARINASSIDIARLKAELSGLEEEFKPFKGVELLKGKTVEELKVMVRNAEQKLESFGAVNLRALEVYEQARNELQVLTEKLRKLEQERQDVLLMINEIDSKKRDIFLKTYEALNKNFKATFKLLSTKGEAFLELENPKNPFEGGVLVKVRLKGTKFLDVRSLSGGEKTLTALAFIFAVQEFEPAFFYVFDEVDSALDKKNSEKLSLLIKDYSRTAQYIIITHNDALIEQADVLFGVSIDENGVSKVTSIKLED